jgi:arsenite/tail-anchored protein-transporting ATPase
VLGWWMQRLFPIQRKAMGMARPLLKSFIDLPLPSDEVYASIEKLFGQLEELHKMMVDPDQASIRLVFNPERMVVKEAQRTYLYMNLFQYPCDMAICNRVIPAEVEDPYFAHWKKTQAEHIELAREAFTPLPMRLVPLFDDQVVGLAQLGRMAEVLFPGEDDPAGVYFRGQSHTIESVEGGYRMTINLPSALKGEVSLRRVGDELFVRVGPYRRTIMLPRTLVGLEPRGAKLDAGVLTIRFERSSEGAWKAEQGETAARR